MANQNTIKDDGLSIVLGSYNRKSFLKLTIESIRRELAKASFPSEIIVIDGGSTDGTIKWLTKQKDIITIIQHNRGTWNGKVIERKSWGYFMNLGFHCAQGKYICMLSDDCLVVPGAIINGYNLFEEKIGKNEKIGAISFYWREWPRNKKYMIASTKNQKMLLNHGIFLKTILQEVGFIDEDNFFFYNADSDLCLKIWHAGYSIIESPNSYIEHYAHANIKARAENTQMIKSDNTNFITKWKGYLGIDAESENLPFYYWIEKEYDDPNRTVEKFGHLILLDLKYNFSKVLAFIKREGLSFWKAKS
jgi:glycosyltransferase involved in cell wall biosynthesis